ncbi:cytoplasmic tRNA 2-thiolation protein 1 isoform X4 [Cherax quadricarinatus]|uniref:cytoplasmic tRNA 2-thiolation protein 1 isoform X4 n=1 Tax=Cherax quadricarinatus TaxID=27406 RepID=UPI00387E472A
MLGCYRGGWLVNNGTAGTCEGTLDASRTKIDVKMPVKCNTGCQRNAVLKRPKTGYALCKECFFWAFEEEVHHTITTAKLFTPGDYVAIAASGYRDDSLETVKRNEQQYEIPLKIVSYEELYGWTMDRIVKKIGRKSNCTFCGVFRRQALDRGASLLKVDKIVTGHNADDIAETVLMNILRGDIARLQRCTAIVTGSEGAIPRSKPFKYTYEKEIVMYAYFKKLDYFSTECIYSPNAYRGYARAFLKDLEKIRPTSIIDIIHSGECFSVREGVKLPTQATCERCGHISSQSVCKACVLLEGLNKGKPRLGIGKTSKAREHMEELAISKPENECTHDCQTSVIDLDRLNLHVKNTNLEF